jgi:glycosyltransferase involved in cell wall biosynthesis
LTIPFSDGVVASCEAFADDYRKLAAETPVWVNYYGLDPSPFAGSVPRLLREELGLSDSDVLVGMVAHMYPTQLRAFGAVGVKGHEVFIDAAGSVTRERPTVHFVVVGSEFIGDGSYEARLRSRARDAGIERLSFLGHRTDVPSILSSCDIVVVPSMSESASYAAIEAGLLRRPVIGSDVGGIPDTVVDGRSGILVPPGDSRALTRAVMALASDADLRARLGEEAHSRCLAKFDVTVTVQKLEEIYRDVVGRREAG